jgi:hypothetical protein
VIKPWCEDCEVCGVLVVVVGFANSYWFFEKDVSKTDVGHLDHIRAWQQVGWHFHVGLDHDKGTQCGDHAIGFCRAIHADDGFLRPLSMQNWLWRVDIGEEELYAAVDKRWWQQAGCARRGGGDCAGVVYHVGGIASGELSIALVLTQFGEDFGAAPLGALLLRDGVVGACQASWDTVLARVCAFTDALYFASMAAVEGVSIEDGRGRRRWWTTNLSQARLTGAMEAEVEAMMEQQLASGWRLLYSAWRRRG